MKHILLILIIFIANISAFAEASPSKVYVNNEIVIFDTEPIIEDGRLLVPLRPLFEKMGLNVVWCQAFNDINVLNAKMNIRFNTIKGYYYANFDGVHYDASIKLINSTAYIPLRTILEAIGAEILWDNASRSAFIEYEVPVNTEFENCEASFKYLCSGLKEFSIGPMGYSGQLSDEAFAFHKIFKSENPKYYFEKLCTEGDDIGKLYGLCGLFLLDNKNIADTVKSMEFENDFLYFASGCTVHSRLIEEFKKGVLDGSFASMLHQDVGRINTLPKK